jgi:hypothetical protein
VLLEALPLALALVPQATLPPPFATVAPAPLAVPGGTIAPLALPTQTNCACADGAPSSSAIASAVPADETKDHRTRFMRPLTPQKRACKSDSTRASAAEDGAIEFRLSCLIFCARVARSTRRIYLFNSLK